MNLLNSEEDKNTYMITLLLGCLQNGLSKNHLYDVIDLDSEIIEQSLTKLERVLFLQYNTEEKVKANSYIVSYVKNGINQDD